MSKPMTLIELAKRWRGFAVISDGDERAGACADELEAWAKEWREYERSDRDRWELDCEASFVVESVLGLPWEDK